MKEYFVEIVDDDTFEQSARVVSVMARDAEHAHKIAREKHMKDYEFVYQIATDTGSALPQPLYDYFNGYYEGDY